MTSTSPTISRRDLVKAAGGGVAAAAVITVAPSVAKAQEKVRYAMIIDTRRCSGCQACSITCKTEFQVPLGTFRSWVEFVERGDFPNTQRRMEPRLCNHCSEPPCVEPCPVVPKATYKRDDGIVVVDRDRCIGCAKCAHACPYDARSMNPTIGDPEKTNGVGAVDKCDFCLHRIKNGVAPACVNTCMGKARIFGDLNDPNSEVAKLFDANETTVLLREKKTKPSVFYIGAEYIEDDDALSSQSELRSTNRLERDSKRHGVAT